MKKSELLEKILKIKLTKTQKKVIDNYQEKYLIFPRQFGRRFLYKDLSSIYGLPRVSCKKND